MFDKNKIQSNHSKDKYTSIIWIQYFAYQKPKKAFIIINFIMIDNKILLRIELNTVYFIPYPLWLLLRQTLYLEIRSYNKLNSMLKTITSNN